MRLVLPTDPAWPIHVNGTQLVAVVGTDALLAWGPLVEYPEDVAHWRRRALAVDVPANGVIETIASEQHVTRSGWRFDVVEARAHVGGASEARLAGFFRFLEHGAVALVRASRAAELARIRASVIAAWSAARPVWAETPLALHDVLAV